MLKLLLVAGIALIGCGAEPQTYAAPGDPSYQRATLCTTEDLAPFLRDAAERWHDAAAKVNLSVRVVDAPQSDPAGCDANVYVDARLSGVTGDEGFVHSGLILVDGSDEFMSDASDVFAHEIGHLLIGGTDDEAHSTDPASVMFGRDQAGEQELMSGDVAKIGKFAR